MQNRSRFLGHGGWWKGKRGLERQIDAAQWSVVSIILVAVIMGR
jgi:hypothetical protein